MAMTSSSAAPPPAAPATTAMLRLLELLFWPSPSPSSSSSAGGDGGDGGDGEGLGGGGEAGGGGGYTRSDDTSSVSMPVRLCATSVATSLSCACASGLMFSTYATVATFVRVVDVTTTVVSSLMVLVDSSGRAVVGSTPSLNLASRDRSMDLADASDAPKPSSLVRVREDAVSTAGV